MEWLGDFVALVDMRHKLGELDCYAEVLGHY